MKKKNTNNQIPNNFAIAIGIFLVLGVIAFFGLAFVGASYFKNQLIQVQQDPKVHVIKDVNSYEECVALGYPQTTIYPGQCTTPDGSKTFTQTTDISINNYNECIAAGYPALESNPPQCKTPDGKTFIAED